MAVTIKTISDKKLFVNNKEVIQDMDGDWICESELSPTESKALKAHLNSI